MAARRRKRDTINRAAQRQLEAIGYASGPDPPDNGSGDDRVKKRPKKKAKSHIVIWPK